MTCKIPSWSEKSERRKSFPDYPIFTDERTWHIRMMAKTLFFLPEGKAERRHA